ncbi:MAG: hypothetical protein PHU66_09225 [Bacteroidaceae bacterium]|nr:hypothetical protein [Bacteroidaceae bacterium]
MKEKIISVILLAFILMTFLSGCSSAGSDFKVVVSKSDILVTTVTENAEDELKKIMVTDSTPLFKDTNVSESKGLFYNSYTFKATTNIADSSKPYTITVTMPGSVTQSKDGEIKNNTVIFTVDNFSQENEIVAYSDSNNIGVVVGILAVLVIILVSFVYFTKKKG